MLCDQCGAHNPDENNFCGRCGVRLLRYPIPKFAEPASQLAETARVLRTSSVGGALSSLGVDDFKDAKDVGKREPEKAIVVTADPIKPPAYLEEENIPPMPRSVVEHTLPKKPLDDERDEPTTISGPSFLGLTDSSDGDQTSYLLEDNRPRGGGAWIVLLLLLAILGGIIWWQRDAIQRAGFNIPFLRSASQQQPNPQPATNANSIAASSSQPDKTSADQPDRFTTTDPSAVANDAGSARPASGSAAGTTTASTPDTKADDTAATESAQSRQAQESKQRQADASGKADQNSSNDKPMLSAADSKPTAAAGEAQPDPHQNKMLQAGEKYLYGRGVPRSCDQAMIYFRAAADQNNAPAMSHLAALYNSGECVKQDTSQAYNWLLRAHDADPNNVWIERDLEMMKRQMASK